MKKKNEIQATKIECRRVKTAKNHLIFSINKYVKWKKTKSIHNIIHSKYCGQNRVHQSTYWFWKWLKCKEPQYVLFIKTICSHIFHKRSPLPSRSVRVTLWSVKEKQSLLEKEVYDSSAETHTILYFRFIKPTTFWRQVL